MDRDGSLAPEEFYAAVLPALLRFCRSLAGGDSALGEDLAQDALLRALTDERFPDLDPAARRAWLYRTAKHLLIDRVRRRKREESRLALLYSGEEAEDRFGEVEMVELLGLLPPEKRLIFQLRYLEGYSAREIAELLDQNPATVRSDLLRIRRTLAAQLLSEEQNGKEISQ